MLFIHSSGSSQSLKLCKFLYHFYQKQINFLRKNKLCFVTQVMNFIYSFISFTLIIHNISPYAKEIFKNIKPSLK